MKDCLSRFRSARFSPARPMVGTGSSSAPRLDPQLRLEIAAHCFENGVLYHPTQPDGEAFEELPRLDASCSTSIGVLQLMNRRCEFGGLSAPVSSDQPKEKLRVDLGERCPARSEQQSP